MAGISSRAVAFGKENRYKYNGIELDTALGLNEYEAFFRDLDPQTGRWWQIDPKTDGYENLSPYASMYDHPMKISDPLGDEGEGCCLTGGVVNWLFNLADKFTTSRQKDNARALVKGTGSTIKQMGQNFKARWNARVDPLHQLADNPMSFFNGIGELNFFEGSLVIEGKTFKILNNGIKSSKYLSAERNAFEGLTSINDIGKMGETLTKRVLEKQFKGADILEQVNIKMDGASVTADFVVVKDGKVVGIFESKVNESSLSNSQKLFFNDGDVGTLTGKNAGSDLQGVMVDPSKIKTGIYRWNSKTGSYTIE
jgi:RHS repeat-associated protein